jgi:cbb3-type cytochrome oxidase subunit 3
MLRDWLSGTSLLDLPVVAMCLFLFFFLAVLWRVTRRGHAQGYDEMARLPLHDDSQQGRVS